MNVVVEIKKNVPLTIFDEPVLKDRVAEIFANSEEKIKSRVNEINTFLDMGEVAELSYDNILFLFKNYFYKLILNEVIEIIFSNNKNYDLLLNILELLSEENLEGAIIGEPMIDAFSTAIRSIPVDSGLDACMHGSKIMLIRKEFLGKTIFPVYNMNSTKEQRNSCGECGCSCTCDGSCEGDTKKCSSKKALEKGCSHHCNCFIQPWAKNIRNRKNK